MFTHQSTSSANKPEHLQPGIYRGRAVAYRLEGDAGEFVMSEFSASEAGDVVLVELLVRPADDSGVHYADFLKLPDGLWRDSNGKKARALAELLPPAALTAVQVEAVDLGGVEHRGGGQ